MIAIIFLVIGIVSSWEISSYFYEKSYADSKASTSEAERVNQLILHGIESVGTIKYSHDNSGKIVGVKIELSGKAIQNTTAKGTLTAAP